MKLESRERWAQDDAISPVDVVVVQKWRAGGLLRRGLASQGQHLFYAGSPRFEGDSGCCRLALDVGKSGQPTPTPSQFAIYAFELGALDYLLKPLTPQPLQMTIAWLRECPDPPSCRHAKLNLFRFWQIHDSLVIKMSTVESIYRSFKATLGAESNGRGKLLSVSSTHAHLFKQV